MNCNWENSMSFRLIKKNLYLTTDLVWSKKKIPWKSLATLNESIFNTEWGFGKILLFDDCRFFCDIPLGNDCCCCFVDDNDVRLSAACSSESYGNKADLKQTHIFMAYKWPPTNGSPSSLRPQLTWPNKLRSTSATGDTNLAGGKIWSLHVAHVRPLGEVFAGIADSLAFKQSQWNTSGEKK